MHTLSTSLTHLKQKFETSPWAINLLSTNCIIEERGTTITELLNQKENIIGTLTYI